MKKLFNKCLISKEVFCISRDLSQDEIGKGKNTEYLKRACIYYIQYFLFSSETIWKTIDVEIWKGCSK